MAANLGLALVSLSLAIAVTEVALRVLESRAPGGKEQRELGKRAHVGRMSPTTAHTNTATDAVTRIIPMATLSN